MDDKHKLGFLLQGRRGLTHLSEEGIKEFWDTLDRILKA